MSSCAALDTVLAGLARPFGSCSDLLLDLRSWAGCDRHAGSCVRAYFELFEEAAPGGEAARGLAGLRRWLEAKLEIEVFDAESRACLETLPVRLTGETSLEDFCHKAMAGMRVDRCHAQPQVGLTFRFRQELAQAA